MILLGERVLIKKQKTEEEKVNGLYIPQSAVEEGRVGQTLAVGEVVQLGTDCVEDIQVGDMVFFVKYDNVDFDSEHVIVLEEDIHAKAL